MNNERNELEQSAAPAARTGEAQMEIVCLCGDIFKTLPDMYQHMLMVHDDELLAEGAADPPAAREGETFQHRVRAWVLDCFGPVIANDMTERSFRFLEEALELVQVSGCTREQAHRLVDYSFDRPAGQQAQEVGGVLVTLAALTSAAGVDMEAAGERELARVLQPEITAKIRRKQASKRDVVSHAAAAALPGEWNT